MLRLKGGLALCRPTLLEELLKLTLLLLLLLLLRVVLMLLLLRIAKVRLECTKVRPTKGRWGLLGLPMAPWLAFRGHLL